MIVFLEVFPLPFLAFGQRIQFTHVIQNLDDIRWWIQADGDDFVFGAVKPDFVFTRFRACDR